MSDTPAPHHGRAEETRQRLLHTAEHLFAADGYDATRVRAISREAGVADGLLYHHFPGGKQALLQTLLKERCRVIIAGFDAHITSLRNLPIADALERIYTHANDVLTSHITFFRIMSRERTARALAEYEQSMALFQQRGGWFPAMLAERAAAGEIAAMDYTCAAELVQALIMNHVVFTLAGFRGPLSDSSHRRRLAAYQAELWHT